MSEHLNIFQYGGCGALYFMHQLLITKKYNCVHKMYGKIENTNDSIRNYAFTKPNHNRWKDTELFPDNNLTLKFKKIENKIFYTVNDFENWFNYPGKKVLVYTDLYSQIRLNWYKKTKFFYYLENKYEVFYPIAKKILLNNKINNNNSELHFEINEAIKFADIKVKFQNLLTTKNLEVELNKFNCDISQENIDFMNYYVKLHPPKLLKKIGINV